MLVSVVRVPETLVVKVSVVLVTDGVTVPVLVSVVSVPDTLVVIVPVVRVTEWLDLGIVLVSVVAVPETDVVIVVVRDPEPTTGTTLVSVVLVPEEEVVMVTVLELDAKAAGYELSVKGPINDESQSVRWIPYKSNCS